MRVVLAPSRRSTSPAPGKPPANVENRRRKRTLLQTLSIAKLVRYPRKSAMLTILSFQSSMMPRFKPMVAA